jgi:hypothetical protein
MNVRRSTPSTRRSSINGFVATLALSVELAGEKKYSNGLLQLR